MMRENQIKDTLNQIERNITDSAEETMPPNIRKICDDMKRAYATLNKWHGEIEAKQIRLEETSRGVFERVKETEARYAELTAKEEALLAAEIKAENGFADKRQTMLREIEARLGDCRQREEEINRRDEKLLALAETMRKREEEIASAERERDAGFSEQREALFRELDEKRATEEKKLDEIRISRFKELENSVAAERQSRIASLDAEINARLDSCRTETEDKMSSCDKEIKAKKDELERWKLELDERAAKLEKDRREIDTDKTLLDAEKSNLGDKERRINEIVEQKVEDRKKSFEGQIEIKDSEIERLRAFITNAEITKSLFDDLERRLGDKAPEAILKELEEKEERIQQLRRDLSNPSKEMQDAIDDSERKSKFLENENNSLREKNRDLEKEKRSWSDLEMDNQRLGDELKGVSARNKSLEAMLNQRDDEVDRLRAVYGKATEREERVRSVLEPYFGFEKLPPNRSTEISEIDWLEEMNRLMLKYGFKFQKRILYAFHTSLKIAEWSPLVILSGVSGTGKSELPRLYSYFGGLNFLPLSVQPNWDSQESMLGFFNSIDNKFDAQPVLRFLAQTQQDRIEPQETVIGYPGLNKTMNMVLLDEMNLAHVELYFAEFLSKLELRRGMKEEIPELKVKLGAGIAPFDLKLGRNVLWVGTMNQDETTKSLSDKVLDRGTVINFPRPTELHDRRELKPLDGQSGLLPMAVWGKWVQFNRKDETNEKILGYKTFIEDINASLEHAGRALGHRVWQSIAYYMANYPEVIQYSEKKDDRKLEESLRTAFEDQLVQKVMPKLRGIETAGTQKEKCLDKIREKLVGGGFNRLLVDFDIACKSDYRQFSWNSANYLKESDDFEDDEKNGENPELQSDSQ